MRRFSDRIAQLFRGTSSVDQLLDNLEELLLLADVGPRLVASLLAALRALPKGKKTLEGLKAALKSELLTCVKAHRMPEAPGPKPAVILLLGVNGVGKTTTLAKLAYFLKQSGKSVLAVAGDTFRAAAIEQLAVWGKRLDIPVVAQGPNSDPGAVLYDALGAARARGVDVVLMDTAGRLHTKKPLVDELAKLGRIIDKIDPSLPRYAYLVLDAVTGQNGLAQAKIFSQALQIDAVILSKWDGSAKGGVLFAIGRELGLPIAFVGTGETLEALQAFDPRAFVAALFEDGGAHQG